MRIVLCLKTSRQLIGVKMAVMKINYVSIKGYEATQGGMKLCLRAELDGEPSRFWSRQFRRTWLSRNAGGSSTRIRFSGNDILLYLQDADALAVTLDALKNTLVEVENQLG